MILMTLGTISFPFDRAVLWLKILIERGVISESVFLQYGTSDVSILKGMSSVTLEPTITAQELVKLVDASRLVISHAGQGSTKMLAAKGASFVILPRLKRYGEHVDDHQLLFARSVAKFGIKSFLSLDELEKAIVEPPPYFQEKIFAYPRLTDYLLTQYPPKNKTIQLVS
ncbi:MULTISPECIES: glycosyltransferase [unclassified Tolypothrix]|uniref:glycosyltransferase n=1 Tax=unclassified Tolypothrix TaxID=2649714 RepID=UPI0005EAC018|nr:MULTISPECIES: glycosyltransferase [unclassified Tolypothrix]BAY93083.1 glycosyltransferase 28 domain protein [Microchaete diplosiphon NIES-3275]EKF00329.1 glycosyltransferase family 28 protein [Tolypothrix sp. PCC 7601]MBE9081896.1 glycosyl transferase [Tolypothrix sp. LEGE 11397]UYD26962.1 glycosyl transferase [Tolypothrix sp. PCC 7712]UYD37179.1 glycosyl transferase [Tolypothrix sp. PCC 7601]